MSETEPESIKKEDIAPFFSILICEGSGEIVHSVLHERISELVKEEEDGEVNILQSEEEIIGDNAHVLYTRYLLKEQPSWLSTDVGLFDLENHVIVSFCVSNIFAFYFSDSQKKDLAREFIEDELEGVDSLDPGVLNHVFVDEDNINMLWLSGIHGRDGFRADTKVLGGDSVADTLDPILDQSYAMSAVKTKVDLDSPNAAIGVNPAKSSIWRGPCPTWQDFQNKVINVLDLISSERNVNDSPISFLSYPISSCDDVGGPFDFSVVDPEFLSERVGARRLNLSQILWHDFFFEIIDEVHPGKGNIYLEVYNRGVCAGSIKFNVSIKKRRLKIEVISCSPKKGMTNKMNQVRRICSSPEVVKCWFDTGHALVNGRIFRTGYNDVTYDDFVWANFTGIDLKKEKPKNTNNLEDLSKIGADNSLFCWVKREWNKEWRSLLGGRGDVSDEHWLYCDDGAGEKSDFIYLTKAGGEYKLFLIHVKSAKTDTSNRRISVGAYDVVLSQAVKNLRYCVRKNLHNDLKERISKSSDKMCWKDNNPVDANDFISELDAIAGYRGTLNAEVVVIQPHTRKSYYSVAESKIRCQLDVLLVSASNAIRSSGSRLHVIGSNE